MGMRESDRASGSPSEETESERSITPSLHHSISPSLHLFTAPPLLFLTVAGSSAR
jgi:hypothetical protein